jgi:hypothetical protein
MKKAIEVAIEIDEDKRERWRPLIIGAGSVSEERAAGKRG